MPSSHPAVPAIPPPPNHPKSFWAPCDASPNPTKSRASKSASVILSSFRRRWCPAEQQHDAGFGGIQVWRARHTPRSVVLDVAEDRLGLVLDCGESRADQGGVPGVGGGLHFLEH